MNRRLILLGVVLAVVLSLPLSVSAAEQYYDTNPSCTYGSWNSNTHEATEQSSGWTHRLIMIWNITDVPTDGKRYEVEIDYDDVTPTGHNYEGLLVHYRWGTSGSWTHIVTLRLTFEHTFYEIDDATSSILQIKFEDESQLWFEGQHTWDFGSYPVLWVYYSE
ncbi:MAG: hypothetical protein ACOC38_02615 [Promethearchaeia archaeon]